MRKIKKSNPSNKFVISNLFNRQKESWLIALLIFCFFALFRTNFSVQAYSSDLFVTTWQTNVEGATEPTKVTLNFLKDANDTYEVSWDCSDNFLPFSESKITHDYGEAGTYDICVKSTAPLHFYAPGLATDERAKLLEIKQWGTIPWSSFASAFIGMVNMQLTATDIPNLSAVTDMSSAFEGATNFTGNSSMNNWVTSNVTNMNSIFKDATNFNSPIGGWNTSQVINMASMFRGAKAFNQYIGKWETGAVSSMAYMFAGATVFNNGESSGTSTKPLEWNTGSVTNMEYMFNEARSFNQDIGDWQTGLVKSMIAMFSVATAFNQDIGGWDTSKVTTMHRMFQTAIVFNQDISEWNTENVEYMSNMFHGARAFNQDIGGWDTSKVTTMHRMFYEASAFNQDIGDWNTGSVSNMNQMFYVALNFNNGQEPGLSNNPLNWNTENVSNMNGLFHGARSFNQPFGDNWDTKSARYMSSMFQNAKVFNQDISNWNTSLVENMSYMFSGASVFNNGGEPGTSSNPMNWNTIKVTNMSYMFDNALQFNQPFGDNWNTGAVINMRSMFANAKMFNQDIGNWNTGKVENISFMFQNAHTFNNGAEPNGESKPLNWNTAKVTNMAAMFNYAYQFNQPFSDNWNTAKVTNMTRMFDRATSFNQDISSWDVSEVEYFDLFLNGSNMQYNNYDNLLNAWSGKTVKPNRTFSAVGVNYCYAGEARAALMGEPSKWTINDSGQNCPPQNIRLSNENAEVEENTTEVGIISAEDTTAITYSLVPGEGSADNTKFNLDSTTGALAFSEAPDYENPTGQADPDDLNKYTIRVRATDATDLYSEQIFIITVLDVDDLPPEIIIDQITKMSKETITDTTFTVSDRFSISSIEVDDSSVATAEILSCEIIAGSSTSPGFPYVNDPPDPENHLKLKCTINIHSSGRLVLKATDGANLSSYAYKDGYVVDKIAPTFISSSIDTLTHGMHRPIVRFEAYDAVGMDRYEIKYIGSNKKEKVDIIDYIGPGEIEQELELDSERSQHTITVTAYDLVGNTTVKKTVFPPEVIFTASTTISNQPINNSTVTIATPGFVRSISKIEITGDAADDVSLEDCVPSNPPSNTPITCRLHNIHKSGTITVLATDAQSDAIGYNSQAYIIDTENPVINISAPTKAKNSNITNTTITITDAVEIHSGGIKIATSSLAMAEDLNCTPDATDNNIINCTVVIKESGNLAIEATDRAGNSIIESEDNYIIDRIAPEVSITSTSSINKMNKTSYVLEGTCTAGDGNISIIIGEQSYKTACTASSTWSINLDLSAQPDGAISIQASQTDAVGNKDTATKELTKDTISPIVGYETIRTNNLSPKLTGIINDNSATVQVRIQQTGQILAATNNNGIWTVAAGQINNLTSNTYNLIITATDPVGNSHEITDQLIIDNIKPYITAITPAPGQQNPTNQQPIIFHVTFSEPLKDNTLDAAGFQIKENDAVTIAQVTNVTRINNTKFALSVSNIVSQSASITVFSPANTYQDTFDNWNTDETESSPVTFNKIKSDVTVEEWKPNSDYLDPTNLLNNSADTDFRFQVVFSKPIATSTLSVDDFLITGGSYIDAEVSFESDTSAFLIFKPTDNATYTVFLPAGRVADAIGNLNNASISVDNRRTYDTISPLVTINQSPTQIDPTNIDSVRYTVIFSEKINEDTFTKEDIVLSGSATAKVEKITKISNTEFEVEVNGLTKGDTVIATIPANVLTDLATNGNVASDSTDNSITYPLDPPINNNTGTGESSGCVGCLVNPVAPIGGFTVKINNNAAISFDRNVTLKFNAGDDIKKMAISMTGDFTDASLEDYTPTKEWDLCSRFGGITKNPICLDGEYTVYVKFYTAYGRATNGSIASNTITLKSRVQEIIETNKEEQKIIPFFTKYLKRGQSDFDVKRLQVFLNNNTDTKLANTGAGSPGKETNYFGTLTYDAVVKFQEKYAKDVLTPWGLTTGTGYAAKTTIGKINELLKTPEIYFNQANSFQSFLELSTGQ